MLTNIYAMLMAGFSLGLLHALDADHVMAVTTLSAQKPSFKRTVLFGMQWAVGHGAILMLCGLLLFGLSIQLPDTFVALAESSVGVLLIVIGLMCLRQCYQQKLTLVEHEHDGVKHTHWCLNEVEHTKKNEHAPVFVGMLHGLAGSAPALAVVPMMVQPDTEGFSQLGLAMAYLGLFSVGVLLSMTLYGTGLGALQNKLKQTNIRVFQLSRYVIALASIGLGGYWLTA